jgi:hypothetical protein
VEVAVQYAPAGSPEHAAQLPEDEVYTLPVCVVPQFARYWPVEQAVLQAVHAPADVPLQPDRYCRDGQVPHCTQEPAEVPPQPLR